MSFWFFSDLQLTRYRLASQHNVQNAEHKIYEQLDVHFLVWLAIFVKNWIKSSIT